MHVDVVGVKLNDGPIGMAVNLGVVDNYSIVGSQTVTNIEKV